MATRHANTAAKAERLFTYEIDPPPPGAGVAAYAAILRHIADVPTEPRLLSSRDRIVARLIMAGHTVNDCAVACEVSTGEVINSLLRISHVYATLRN